MANWGYYEPTRPIAVSGGIKLQSRGTPKTEAWAGRWLASLESLYMGTRLQAGRTYARKGQVLSIDISAGRIMARVQGSQPRPYEVTIDMAVLGPLEKARLIEALTAHPLIIAKLLAGELPHEVADLFQERKIVLFPTARKEMTTTCTCPDSANPCKHIAAVFAIAGEQFDRDPFLILKLRGLDRSELLAALPGEAPGAPTKKTERPAKSSKTEPVPEPELPIDPKHYWAAPALPPQAIDVRLLSSPASLPGQLGVFPFWRGDRPLLEVLPDIYTIASQAAVAALAGDPPARPAPPVVETKATAAAPVKSRGRRPKAATQS